MQSNDDGSTRRPSNIFLHEFLQQLRQRDEPSPSVSAEASKAGPWRVEEIPATFYGVYATGQDASRGDRAIAIFGDWYHALLISALIPATGRDPLYRLHKEPTPDGYAVETGGEVIGHLAVFDDKLIDALHVVECLLRSPEALASLFEAAGPVILERAGAILSGRVRE
ncbi:MAG TPA: hypothetical protein VEL74_20415 [Thermoanaerobaculia bacterium]|nr:hypothetical protein [Thermoanaerobaculia bacterium]